MKDMSFLMQQAKKMQARMEEMQNEIKSLEVTGESGAGLVKVVMSGRHDVRRVHLDASLKDEELEMIEDLVAAAVNDAVRKVDEVSKDKMGQITGGMPMPPGFDSKL
jgi:nucleoid-associated protein EbfC